MSDTPRTDAAAYIIVGYPHHEKPFEIIIEKEKGDSEVDAEFARSLEKELKVLTTEVLRLEEVVDDFYLVLKKIYNNGRGSEVFPPSAEWPGDTFNLLKNILEKYGNK